MASAKVSMRSCSIVIQSLTPISVPTAARKASRSGKSVMSGAPSSRGRVPVRRPDDYFVPCHIRTLTEQQSRALATRLGELLIQLEGRLGMHRR
ncbi:hypothetical protein NWFMUON74_48790 [Nocardia wallacei]|uniref:Uncharacterized protein n=1 Tax=Nocardia wallacei TaxID=480035 RepID=A0A7G1KPG8_9NOCA|nr:hypothetical protein NWFMUON74_48790 [Nocardia wallacei]